MGLVGGRGGWGWMGRKGGSFFRGRRGVLHVLMGG